MAYRIVASKMFERSLAGTVRWIKKEWSDRAAESFNKKILAAIEKITFYPTSGRKSAGYKNVRSVLISKHNRMYYRISGKTITLLELFETKQDPQKNKYE